MQSTRRPAYFPNFQIITNLKEKKIDQKEERA